MTLAKINWFHTQLGDEERDSILLAYDSRRFSQGPFVAELEHRLSQLLQVPYLLMVPSGTAALTLSLMSAGVGPGDEVIVPDLTWIATGQAAKTLGATVVLADCLEHTPLIDMEQVRAKITDRTKAIIPVHLNGKACDLNALQALACPLGIKIIEDACKAMFVPTSKGYLGTIGDYGAFSTGMISLVNTGYGGFVVTRDASEYEKMKLMRDHGLNRVGGEKFLHMGWNFKMSDMQAAIALGMIDKINGKIAHVKTIYRHYAERLEGNEFVHIEPVDLAAGAIPLLADLRSSYRDTLESYLLENEVGISPWHIPLHKAPYFADQGTDVDFPQASKFSREGFVAPCGPSQPLENIDRVCDLLNQWSPG